MKKVIALLVVLLLCAVVAVPAVATGTFVGSPNDNTAPDHDNVKIESTTPVDEELAALLQSDLFLSVGDCVVVTNVAEAEEKSTDISQEARDLLLDVYAQMADGTMVLPIEGDFSVRDLVDVSFEYEGCEKLEEHGNKAQVLKQPGVTLSVDFDLGVAADEELVVMTYIDEEWAEIESVTNNGDGTVTCVFEDICPVAFAVLG